ncbi:50S ribosomal protein L21 [Clostridium sp. D2Q-14]|uniref:50S ribosomal protein L21 n=1 Tax=Anaeromonas gelatinilytica TaxID=2683194 RepID=UPI00193C39C1|nr:50S ribosomal protein L21 [Anaeromonas gelatinilytica]MBS4535859.1 50S ribosomal protein L21 [Anaeromonas gelatinilytica]
MYAVIETGGKQYRVQEGDTLFIEKIAGNEGDSVNFDKVLLVSDNGDVKVGNPFIGDVTVDGSIVEQGKGKKIIVYKYKAKKDYRRKQGHRQPYTKVKIEKING